jgi:FkbM family methyltransferase
MRRIKNAIKTLRLQRPALACAKAYARLFPRQLCSRNGIYYDLDLTELIDFSIFLGGWETETLDFLRQRLRPNDVVVEIGANIGAHTLVMAQFVGPGGTVYAFEPTEYASRKLQRNIELNHGIANIVLRRELVTNGMADLPRRNIRSSWKLKPDSQIPTEAVSASATSIDEFAVTEGIDQLSLLKIDVDGYDFKVLQGARETLTRLRPTIFVELCEYALQEQGDSVDRLLELLLGLGYRGQYLDGTPIADSREVLQRVGLDTSINGVFLPA